MQAMRIYAVIAKKPSIYQYNESLSLLFRVLTICIGLLYLLLYEEKRVTEKFHFWKRTYEDTRSMEGRTDYLECNRYKILY